MSLPLLHAGKSAPGLSAALDLRFALDKSLTAYRGPTPSFSRASTGSYFDGSGVLRYAALNLNLYSEQFDNAAYTKNQGTISANQATAPDGKLTADSFTASAGTVNPHAYQAVTTVNGSVYTFSIYVKKNTHDFVQIVLNGVANGFANFDINNGVLGTLGAGGSATSSIVNVGNGWYRCVVSYTTASTSGNGFINLIGSATAGRGATFTAAGTESVYLWGQQLELSSTVGTYCPTTSSANSAPRFDHTYNGTSWVSKGLLLEEQRTNAFQWSEDFSNAFWTKLNASIATSSGTSPDGTNTANKITDDSTNGTHRIYRGNVGTAGQPCTTSFYLKAGTARYAIVLNSDNNDWRAYAVADLQTGTITQNGVMVAATGASYIGSSITNCGNGWYRVSVSGTNQSGDANYYGQVALSNSATPGTIPSYIGTGSYIYAVMAQMELNSSFPTSYIKTTSSTVTRSADVCQITGTDFSGFWNGTEGSLVAEYDRLAAVDANFSAGYPRIAAAVKTSDTSRAVTLFASQSPAGEAFYVQDGTVQAWFSAGSLASANAPTKLSAAYKANDFAASLNGASAATDTSGTVPSGIDRIDIGNEYGVTRFHNGHIARVRYYRKRLPNATLQLLSEPDPTLNLQFALNKSLTPVAGPAPSFSRASTGTYFNASGVLTSASINTPRFDHVYSGGQWVSRGLLIEEQRTNLHKYSESISAIYNAGSGSFSSNVTTAPDGALTADKYSENTATDQHACSMNPGSLVGTHTFSLFLKEAGRYKVGFLCQTPVQYVCVNLQTISTFDANGATATIQDVGNGWRKVTVTYNSLTNYFDNYIALLPDSATQFSQRFYTGDGSSGIFVWGTQIEAGSFATSYIPNLSSGSTVRSADVCQITGTSFGSMWNQGEGSYSIEYNLLSTLVDQPLLYANNGSVGESHRVFGSLATNQPPLFYSRSAGSTDGVIAFGATPVASGKIAVGAKVNDLAGSLNGGAVVTDSTVAMPVGINQLLIGIDNIPTRLNGHIANLIYYPARLTNAKLQQLST